jgi:hypothetical protein
MIFPLKLRTALLPTFLVTAATCSTPQDHEANTSERLAAVQIATERNIRLVLRVALHATIQDLGFDEFRPDQVVIQSDYEPPGKDPLRELGSSAALEAQRLAAELGYSAKRRGEVVECDESSPVNRHPCRLNYEGVYYTPVVVKLSADSATVAIHFKAMRKEVPGSARPINATGSRILNLVRTVAGWRVVNAMMVNS